MNKATILIIGADTDRRAALVENFGNRFYHLTAADEETAVDRFLQSPVDAVLFGTGVSDAVRNKLTRLFATQQSDTVFINDNPGADITAEISGAISRQQKENKPAFSFKDDALKKAGLNIQIQ
ncbi:MAG: hypothetical protein QM687_16775 [Ferruginibacter sp.]